MGSRPGKRDQLLADLQALRNLLSQGSEQRARLEEHIEKLRQERDEAIARLNEARAELAKANERLTFVRRERDLYAGKVDQLARELEQARALGLAVQRERDALAAGKAVGG